MLNYDYSRMPSQYAANPGQNGYLFATNGFNSNYNMNNGGNMNGFNNGYAQPNGMMQAVDPNNQNNNSNDNNANSSDKNNSNQNGEISER